MLERSHIDSVKSLPVNSSTICTSLPDLSADSINSDKAVEPRMDSRIPSGENKNNTLTCYSLNGDCGVLNKKETNNYLNLLEKVNRSFKKPTEATLPSLNLMDSVIKKAVDNSQSVTAEEKRHKKKNNSVDPANKFKEDKYGYLFDHEVFKKKYSRKLKVEKKLSKEGDLKIKKKRKANINNDEEKSDMISCKKYKEHSKKTASSEPLCSAAVYLNDSASSEPYFSIQSDCKNKENNNCKMSSSFSKQLISDHDHSCTNKLNENKIPIKSSNKDPIKSDITLRMVVNSIVKNRTPNSDLKAQVHENPEVPARSVELKTNKERVKSQTMETCEEKRKKSAIVSHGELTKNSSNINQSNSKGTDYVAYPNPNRNSENVVIIKKTISTPTGNSSNEIKDDINAVKLTPSEKLLQSSDSKSVANPRNCIKSYSPSEKRETIESNNLANVITKTISEKNPKMNGVERAPVFSKMDGPSGSLDKMNLENETIVTEIHISGISKLSQKLNEINSDVNNTVLNEAKNNDIGTPKKNIFVQNSAKKKKLEEFNMFENVNIDKKVQQRKRKTDKYYRRKYKIKKCCVMIKKLSVNEIPVCYQQAKPPISDMEIDEKKDCEKEKVNTDRIPQIDLAPSSVEVNPVTSVPMTSIDTSLPPNRIQEVMLKYPFLKITSARKSTDGAESSSSAYSGDIAFVKKHNHVSSLIDLGDDKSTSIENNNNNIIVDKSKQMEKPLLNENVIKSPDYEELERPWIITGAVSLSTPVKISFPKNSSPPKVNEQQVMLRNTQCDSQDKMIVSTVGRRPPAPGNPLSDPRLERPTYCGFPYELLGLSCSDRDRHSRITATQRYIRAAVVFKNTSFEGFNCRLCPEGFDSYATWVLHVNSCNKNK